MSKEAEDLAQIEILGESWIILAAVAWNGYQLHKRGVVIFELNDSGDTPDNTEVTSQLYYLPSDTPEIRRHADQNQQLARWLTQYDPQSSLILAIANPVGVFYSHIETPISYPPPPEVFPQEESEIADAMNFRGRSIVNEWPMLSGTAESHYAGAERNVIVVDVHSPSEADIENAIKLALKHAEDEFVNDLRENATSMLAEQRAYSNGFEARLADRWAKALDLFETILTICQEAGSSFNRKHQVQAAKENDLVLLVLTRLHARACLTASEVFALLRTGHASGAHARWRTLHELAVVAYFIKKFGQEVAERYLEHEHIEAYKAAEEYQRHCTRLGYEHYEGSEMKAFRTKAKELVSKYGPEFKQSYGWAAKALREHDPSDKGFDTFTRLEEAVGLDHWRPYYGMANYGIHASTKGITFNLGLINQGEALLAGPSNAGLADPGQCACISISQITTTLLGLKPDLESVVVMKALQQFVTEARDAFIEAQQKLDEDVGKRKK